jgi:exonuclease VII large subunit
MTANKAEFDNKLVDFTHEIRASTKSDTASTARPHVVEAQQNIVQPRKGIIAGAAGTQRVAEIP